MFKLITDNIYVVSTTDNGRFPSSFCFYIDDDIKTLVDTPLDTRFPGYFAAHPVDMILNTHFHRDHTGCNHLFPGAKVYAHPLDIPAMISVETFSEYYGLNSDQNADLKNGLIKFLAFTPSPISGEIQHGNLIDLGKIKLEVIHTPGHTPGHCAFYWKEKQVLFAGDIDLTGFGPWYGNNSSDLNDFIDSIQKVIDLNPKMILSGHKGVITKNIPSRLDKYLQRVYENEEGILAALKTPHTLQELTNRKIIYGSWQHPVRLYSFFEGVSLQVHLRRLIDMGRVCFKDNYYRLTT